MKLKEAMKVAKETGKRVRVTEPEPVSETKINISIRIDASVLSWLKDQAAREGLPYQTLLNSILIKRMSEGSLEDRVARLEKRTS